MTKEDSLEVQRRLGIGDNRKVHWDYSNEGRENQTSLSREIVDTEIHDRSVSGDFDGDGLRETLWIVSDYVNDDGATCTTHLKSNVNIIPGYNWKACNTHIHNLGDINGDNADDLYLNHWGSMGNANYVGVMSLSKSGTWYYSVDEFYCMGESENLRVRKSGEGIIITYNGGEETGDVVKDMWAEHEKFVRPKIQ
ncbi:MAG: hypothetical protein ACKOXR_05530 [Bacteroidota bacterium]